MKYLVLFFIIAFSFSCKKEKSSNKDEILIDRHGNEHIYSADHYFETDEAKKYNALGNTLAREGRYEDARLEFLKADNFEHNNPIVLNNLGNLEWNLDNRIKAIKYYNVAIKVSDSTYLDAFLNLGLQYWRLDKYKIAEFNYNYVLDRTDSDNQKAAIYYNLSNGYIKLDKCVKARKNFNNLIFLKSNTEISKVLIEKLDTLINEKCQYKTKYRREYFYEDVKGKRIVQEHYSLNDSVSYGNQYWEYKDYENEVIDSANIRFYELDMYRLSKNNKIAGKLNLYYQDGKVKSPLSSTDLILWLGYYKNGKLDYYEFKNKDNKDVVEFEYESKNDSLFGFLSITKSYDTIIKGKGNMVRMIQSDMFVDVFNKTDNPFVELFIEKK